MLLFFRHYQCKTLLLLIKLFAQWLILPCCKQALRVMLKHNLMMLTLLHLDDVFNLTD